MISTGMTFKLKPGCYDQYKKAHDELWPEIAEDLDSRQCSMAIYHHDGRLFLHAVYPSAEAMARGRHAEAGAKWAAYMATLLETDASGKSIVETLEPAFLWGMFAPPPDAGAPGR